MAFRRLKRRSVLLHPARPEASSVITCRFLFALELTVNPCWPSKSLIFLQNRAHLCQQ